MRDRLTVGHLVLAQAVGVRALLPQREKPLDPEWLF